MPKLEMKPKRGRPRSRATARERGRPKRSEQSSCIAPDCGRPAYARELCQTHHRQQSTTGKLRSIRPYRKRRTGTVKLAGLRLSHHCAAMVRAHAERTGVSLGAAIADILETWHASGAAADGDDNDDGPGSGA